MPSYLFRVLFVAICCALSLATVAAEEKDEEIEITVLQPEANWPLSIRKLSDRELKESRGEKEDQLRRRVLEVALTKEDIAEARRLMNEPWSRESIIKLTDMALNSVGVQPGGQGVHRTARIFDLLAHLASAYSKEKTAHFVAESFGCVFDAVIRRRETIPYDHWTYPFAINAMADHGTSLLFVESFWAHYEKNPNYASQALHVRGDRKALERLEGIWRRNVFQAGSEAHATLKRDLLVVRAELLDPELCKIKSFHKRVEAAEELRKKNPDQFALPPAPVADRK